MLFESGEMYLETIYILEREKMIVRSVAIAERMGFSKPSVSRAVSNLKQSGYITVDSGYISLTPSGKEIAVKIYERHVLLTDWLVSLGVSEEIASADACRIEHDISDETFEAIKKHLSR